MDTSKREQTKASVAAFLAKHAGPGPHPSGSSQQVHGGGQGAPTRFHVRDDNGKIVSSHKIWGDAYKALQDLTGHPRPPISQVIRTGSPEYELTDLERNIKHLPPKPKN